MTGDVEATWATPVLTDNVLSAMTTAETTDTYVIKKPVYHTLLAYKKNLHILT